MSVVSMLHASSCWEVVWLVAEVSSVLQIGQRNTGKRSGRDWRSV